MTTRARRAGAMIAGLSAVTLGLGSVTQAAAINDEHTLCDGLESLSRINNAPLAVDDETWTAPDSPIVIDVLANDTDFDGDGLFVFDVLNAGHGSATLSDGVVEYFPGLGFEGFDVFSYRVTDGQCGTHRASVRVRVSEEPPLPDEATPEPPVVGIITFTG